MKYLSVCLLIAFLCTGVFVNNAKAQTAAELEAAIAGGPADIRTFLDAYGGNAAGLAALPADRLQEALSSVNGGIENLTDSLNIGEIENLLDELGDLGALGDLAAADLAGGLLYSISSIDNTLGEALTSALGLDFFNDLESIIPGITDLLEDELSSLLGLTGGLEDLITGISGLFGGGGPGGVLDSLLGGGGSLGSVLGGGGGSTSLPTATPMSASCNSDVLIAMETRAWMEAQREITQNQNLIAKPDSVMEYSCFDSFLNVLAQEAETMFSENNTVWSGVSASLITTSDMDNALTELVGTAMNTYITNNFAHSYLGGRGSDNYTPSIPIAGAAYTCDQMDRVWRNAKCINFAVRPEDGFHNFEYYRTGDPRTLPDPCTADPKWPGYIDAVFNTPAWRSNGGANSYDQLMEDTYTTSGEYEAAGSCDASRLILTGLRITESGDEYPDGVCVNPGCFYEPGASPPGTATCSPY